MLGLAGVLTPALAADNAAPAVQGQKAAAGQAGQQSDHHKPDRKGDRRAVREAIFVAEAQVLGMKPEELRDALKHGKSVGELAEAKGISKAQFADRLATQVKPSLDKLVAEKKLSQKAEDKILAAIRAGHIPGWERHHHKPR
jgi:uncharacterized protein YidB (DUF937 family)